MGNWEYLSIHVYWDADQQEWLFVYEGARYSATKHEEILTRLGQVRWEFTGTIKMNKAAGNEMLFKRRQQRPNPFLP